MNRSIFAKRLSLIIVGGLLTGAIEMGCVVAGPPVRTATAVTYADGAAYRTFTDPLPNVSTAALRALDSMGIKVRAQEKGDHWELIRGEAGQVQVQVRLEALTPRSTRVEAIAREGMFSKDQSTATEIILQTETALIGALTLR
jgi:hypothetical protein